MRDPGAFILENTALKPPSLVPEIRLHLADAALPLWEKTEAELEAVGLPPPYWAFAWAGGQALARHLIDNPGLGAGRRSSEERRVGKEWVRTGRSRWSADH